MGLITAVIFLVGGFFVAGPIGSIIGLLLVIAMAMGAARKR